MNKVLSSLYRDNITKAIPVMYTMTHQFGVLGSLSLYELYRLYAIYRPKPAKRYYTKLGKLFRNGVQSSDSPRMKLKANDNSS